MRTLSPQVAHAGCTAYTVRALKIILICLHYWFAYAMFTCLCSVDEVLFV